MTNATNSRPALPVPLTQFPDAHAEDAPDSLAYVLAATGRSVTYRELVDDSKRVAGMLWSRGLRHGDTVAVLMSNDEHLFKVVWALQRSGLRYLVMSTRMKAAELAYVLDDAGASTLITSSDLLVLARAAAQLSPTVRHRFTTGPRTNTFEDLWESSAGHSGPPHQREGVDLLYSSGTTGKPKGVAVGLALASLGTPPGFAEMFRQRWGIGSDSVYLSPAPLYHAAPLRVSMTVHRYGGTVVVMDKFDAESALALIERYKVTETQMVPTMLIRMLKLAPVIKSKYDLRSLRCLVHAAAPMPVSAKHELIEWLGPLVREFYSSTENYLFTELSAQEWLAHPGSVGRALSGTAHILDEAGQELPIGEVGQIWSEGGPKFEYLGDVEKTAQSRNTEGWTTVGDLGYLDEDGYLYMSDRRSDLILCGGVNIYPQEAENLLLTHPDVEDAAVFGIPHSEMGQVPHGLVKLRPKVAASTAEEQLLLAYLREHLAAFKCPKRLDFADELPRLPTGKLQRRALQERYSGDPRDFDSPAKQT